MEKPKIQQQRRIPNETTRIENQAPSDTEELAENIPTETTKEKGNKKHKTKTANTTNWSRC